MNNQVGTILALAINVDCAGLDSTNMVFKSTSFGLFKLL